MHLEDVDVLLGHPLVEHTGVARLEGFEHVFAFVQTRMLLVELVAFTLTGLLHFDVLERFLLAQQLPFEFVLGLLVLLRRVRVLVQVVLVEFYPNVVIQKGLVVLKPLDFFGEEGHLHCHGLDLCHRLLFTLVLKFFFEESRIRLKKFVLTSTLFVD